MDTIASRSISFWMVANLRASPSNTETFLRQLIRSCELQKFYIKYLDSVHKKIIIFDCFCTTYISKNSYWHTRIVSKTLATCVMGLKSRTSSKMVMVSSEKASFTQSSWNDSNTWKGKWVYYADYSLQIDIKSQCSSEQVWKMCVFHSRFADTFKSNYYLKYWLINIFTYSQQRIFM